MIEFECGGNWKERPWESLLFAYPVVNVWKEICELFSRVSIGLCNVQFVRARYKSRLWFGQV